MIDPTSDFEKTEKIKLKFDDISRKREEHIVGPEDGSMVPVLRAINGELLGEYFVLDKTCNVIGRDTTCAIRIPDPRISRRHCAIQIEASGAQRDQFVMAIEDLSSANGTMVNTSYISRPTDLKHGDKIILGANVFGLYLKFSEEVELEKQLYKMATHDPITGLLSRSVFEFTADFEFKKSARYHRELSFIFLDLDHFKSVNDSYGHSIGDVVLKTVGDIMINELRFEDISIRYGGEEFVMILPETPEKQAAHAGERIRCKIENHKFDSGLSTFHITASMGIAERGQFMSNYRDLVQKVDQALYTAKRGGRNRIFLASRLPTV